MKQIDSSRLREFLNFLTELFQALTIAEPVLIKLFTLILLVLAAIEVIRRHL